MAPGRKVSTDLAWTVVRMLPLYPIQHILAITQLGTRTIERIKSRFERTRDVLAESQGWEQGRNRLLSAHQVNVCTNYLNS